jgi:hypothetical protein
VIQKWTGENLMQKIKVGTEDLTTNGLQEWANGRRSFLNKTAELYRLKQELQRNSVKPGFAEKVEVYVKDRSSGDLTRPDAQLKIVARITVRTYKNQKASKKKARTIVISTRYLEFEVNENGDLLRRRKVFPAKNMLHNYEEVKKIVAKLLIKLGESSGDAQVVSAQVSLLTA